MSTIISTNVIFFKSGKTGIQIDRIFFSKKKMKINFIFHYLDPPPRSTIKAIYVCVHNRTTPRFHFIIITSVASSYDHTAVSLCAYKLLMIILQAPCMLISCLWSNCKLLVRYKLLSIILQYKLLMIILQYKLLMIILQYKLLMIIL